MIPIHALLFSKHLFINTPKMIIEPKKVNPFTIWVYFFKVLAKSNENSSRKYLFFFNVML